MLASAKAGHGPSGAWPASPSPARRAAGRSPRRSRGSRRAPARAPWRRSAGCTLRISFASARGSSGARDRHLPVAGSTRPPGNTNLPGMNTWPCMALAHQHLRRRRRCGRRRISVAASSAQVRDGLARASTSVQALGEVGHRRVPRCCFIDCGCSFARRAAAWPRAGRGRPRAAAPVIAAFGQKLEAQRAGDRRRLDQLDRDAVAEPVASRRCGRRPCACAVLVVAEVLVADGARRDEAVGAGVVELDEQAGAGDAGDAALEASRRCGRRGSARSAGRRSRARPSWRAARRPRSARRSRPARARPGCRAGRRRRSFSARISARCTIRSA